MKKPDHQKISEAYQKIATEQPPGELDSKILSAAHAQAPRKSNVVGFKLIPPGWIVPLTVAATIILSVSVVLTIPDSDFQKPDEYDYVMPESVEEQTTSVARESNDVLDNEIRKKANIEVAQETSNARPGSSESALSASEDVSGKPPARHDLMKKFEAGPKPAMSPQPEKRTAKKAGADTVVPLESVADLKTEAEAAMPESKPVLPRKNSSQLARKRLVKKLEFNKFSENIKKLAKGDKLGRVYELLGTPFSKEKNYWQYQYIIEGKKRNYYIRFKNGLVTKVELPM